MDDDHSLNPLVGRSLLPPVTVLLTLALYGFDSCVSCAVSSGETNGHPRLLLLHCTTMRLMQHEHCICYLITTYPLWFEFAHIFLKPSQGSCDTCNSHASGLSMMPCCQVLCNASSDAPYCQVLYSISSDSQNISHSSTMPCCQILHDTSYDSSCH